jgi:predicted small lipoprotein YifL
LHKVILAIVVGALCAGCGKKGPLIPPEALVPAAVTDLRIEQRGGEFRLSWSAPDKEEGGLPLRDLSGFRLARREVLPPGQDCAACLDSWRLLSAIDLAYLQEVRRSGRRFYYTDLELRPAISYQYQVTSVNRAGAVSKPSNRPTRKAVEPPLPPVLQAEPTATGIRLEFVALPVPSKEALVGYNIYRQRPGEPLPLTPLNPRPVTDHTFDDKQVTLGEAYQYRVRTLARIDGELVESAPSNEVSVVFVLVE